MDLSLVIPVKEESENLPELFKEIVAAIEPTGYSFEVIIIDDGSRDCTWDVIEGLSKKDLVMEVGRSDAVGRPILYGTTDEFLKQFGFETLKELPSIEDIEGVLEEDDNDNVDMDGVNSNSTVDIQIEILVQNFVVLPDGTIDTNIDLQFNVELSRTANINIIDEATAPVVLTPHPKEMSRIAGVGVGDIQANRGAVAKSFVKAHKAVLVLKGASTLVADSEYDDMCVKFGVPPAFNLLDLLSDREGPLKGRI